MDKCQRDEYADGPIVYDVDGPVPLSLLCSLQHSVNAGPFRGWPAGTLMLWRWQMDRTVTVFPDGTRTAGGRTVVVLRYRSGGHDHFGRLPVPGLYASNDFGPLDAILPEHPRPLVTE